jgi:hypothetical protein
MLKKLINLIKYLPALSENIHIVGDKDNATTCLNSPALKGRQIVAALPLNELEGNSDNLSGPLVFIVFVLEKALTTSGTPERAQKQYIESVLQLEKILDKIAGDITGAGDGGQCPLLAGFDLQGVQVMPEASIFGGWNGYSATITLR